VSASTFASRRRHLGEPGPGASYGEHHRRRDRRGECRGHRQQPQGHAGQRAQPVLVDHLPEGVVGRRPAQHVVAGDALGGRDGTLEEPEAWRSVLHLKLWIVGGLVLLTAVHDAWLGPLVGRLRREASETPSPADVLLIRLSTVVARVGLLLGVIVLFLAVALART
jgi:hypothetical protein